MGGPISMERDGNRATGRMRGGGETGNVYALESENHEIPGAYVYCSSVRSTAFVSNCER